MRRELNSREGVLLLGDEGDDQGEETLLYPLTSDGSTGAVTITPPSRHLLSNDRLQSSSRTQATFDGTKKNPGFLSDVLQSSHIVRK